jgi:hypothetical protein
MQRPAHRPGEDYRLVAEASTVDALSRQALSARRQREAGGRKDLCLDAGEVLDELHNSASLWPVQQLRGSAHPAHAIIAQRHGD